METDIKHAVLKVMTGKLQIINRTNKKLELSDGSKWNAKLFHIRLQCFKEAISLSLNKDQEYINARKKLRQVRLLGQIQNIKLNEVRRLTESV